MEIFPHLIYRSSVLFLDNYDSLWICLIGFCELMRIDPGEQSQVQD